MQRLLYTLALFSITLVTIQAQAIRVGYYGETVTHYGLKVAYERTLFPRIKSRNQARKTVLVAPGLAAYRHPQNHIGFVFSPELTYRRTGRRGATFEVGIAPAYFRYFLDGTTYEVTDAGDFRRVRLAGGNAFMPTVSVGVGKDWSVQRNLPLTCYTRLNLMLQRPYNTSTLLRFSLEARVIIPFKK